MNMKQILTLTILLTSTIWSQAQQVNPVPDYVFRNQMSVGRNAVTDTAAYFSIGPRYGATKGFMPPIVGDTATFSSGKRNGLLIFSVQKNKFLYWDSVRVQWSDMAGSSGTYITGTGITGYIPQFSGTTTIDTSALFTIGNRLGIGSSTFAYTSTNTANVELNGTSGGILGFKRNDSARGYLWHTGSDMELANTTAGTLSFNTNSATRGSISSAGVWRLHNLAGTGDRVVVASSNGTLSASTSVTGLVDTLTLSTRAWRQKGLDSLAALEVSGSGTTNRISKFTAASTIGNSLLSDDGVELKYTGADGATIQGTTSAFLSLYGTGDNYIQFKDAAGTAGRIQYNHTSDYMSFNTASTERLRIFANGRIGVNTTTDAGYQFDVNGTARINNTLQVNKSDGGQAINIVGNSNTASIQQNGSDMYFNSNTNTTGGGFFFRNSSSFTTRMTIDASGNVGIGTASPAQKLDVTGYVIAGVTDRTLIGQDGTYSGYSAIGFGGIGNGSNRVFGSSTAADGLYLASATGRGIRFRVNGTDTDNMLLQSSGELLINPTTDAGDYKLQVAGNIYNTGSAVLAATSGNVGVGTASPAEKLDVTSTLSRIVVTSTTNSNNAALYFNAKNSGGTNVQGGVYFIPAATPYLSLSGDNSGTHLNVTSSGEVLINTTTDAGDYKLQVVGNARVGTGKLDIASNTTFGLGVARSGTSEVAGQIYNSNGILYTGVESSAGGQIFTGSSAYAAVIGSGANYPLQFATNNATRATINTNGELLIGSTTDAGAYALQVTGAMYTTSTITTASPTADPVRPWKLGSVQAGTVALDTANYVEVEINGTYYRLAIVTPL